MHAVKKSLPTIPSVLPKSKGVLPPPKTPVQDEDEESLQSELEPEPSPEKPPKKTRHIITIKKHIPAPSSVPFPALAPARWPLTPSTAPNPAPSATKVSLPPKTIPAVAPKVATPNALTIGTHLGLGENLDGLRSPFYSEQPLESRKSGTYDLIPRKRLLPGNSQSKRQKLEEVKKYADAVASREGSPDGKGVLGLASIDFLVDAFLLVEMRSRALKEELVTSMTNTRVGVIRVLKDLPKAKHNHPVQFRLYGLKRNWTEEELVPGWVFQVYPSDEAREQWMKKNRHHGPLLKELDKEFASRGWGCCKFYIDGDDLLVSFEVPK
jgi:hypothetical protein